MTVQTGTYVPATGLTVSTQLAVDWTLTDTNNSIDNRISLPMVVGTGETGTEFAAPVTSGWVTTGGYPHNWNFSPGDTMDIACVLYGTAPYGTLQRTMGWSSMVVTVTFNYYT